MSSAADLSLSEARAALDTRQVSSLELVDAVLERAQKVNPHLNAFLRLDADLVRAGARAADVEIARGQIRGPLHGIPLAHKDMFHRAGVSSSYGTRTQLPKPSSTATALARLDAAGALQFGVVNMSAFAVGPTGHNRAMGDCKNPWNPDRIAGGSSSGSAAAVAARATYAALGSDTAGSIRIPAALCGVTGLRPTYGRVSRAGTMGFSFTLDTIGPIARTALDCAMLMNAIAGPDEADPTAANVAAPDYVKRIERPVRGLKVGILALDNRGGIETSIVRLLERSISVFRDLGCEVVTLPFPDLSAMDAAAALILACEGASLHGELMRKQASTYGRQMQVRLERGFAIPAPRYLDALRYRSVALEKFSTETLSLVDVLHLPLIAIPTPTLTESDVESGINVDEVVGQLSRFTRPFSYLGLPSLALPVGFAADGMPVSAQLVARPFGEDLLLRLGHAYQKVTTWHVRLPQIASGNATSTASSKSLGG
jgi:aspartyl-tRNA(Asn)/glutamyl-tRNA(Gln) amidotransferase subunit A